MTDPTPAEARAALAELDHSRATLARGLEAPFVRHLAYAATTAMLVLAITSSRFQAFVGIGALGIVAILQWDRKRYGVFINGYRAGKTLPVTIGLMVVLIGAILIALWSRNHGEPWAGYVAVAVAFFGSLAASYIWQAVYKREMGA